MPIDLSFSAAFGRTIVGLVRFRFVFLALLSGCSAYPAGSLFGQHTQHSRAATPVPPRHALAFDDAVVRMTDALLTRAEVMPPAGGSGHSIVVDPLIDRATGNESVATRRMEQRIADVVRERHPNYELRPFNTATLSTQPLILLGSITPVAEAGVVPGLTAGQPGAYRIWAVLADLRTGTVVAHETAWILPSQVDPTPTLFFRNSPGWLPDDTVAAYLRTCAGNPGDRIDPAYLRSLTASAAVADGVRAYEAGRYQDALFAYSTAASSPAGDQLRVRNGIYLANLALGRQREAETAFGQLVSYGLSRGQIAIKLLFQPGSARYWRDTSVTGVYPMWLRQIARQSEQSASCLSTVGHTSLTGPTDLNDRLSLARAEAVRQQLIRRAPSLALRLAAEGRGSREPVVGTGRDDASDALDRRVEFRSLSCT